MKLAGMVGAALLALVSGRAEAALYQFSYSPDGQPALSGVLDGTLGVDGNSFTIAGVNSLSIDGNPVTANFTVSSTDTNGTAGATLDKSFLDFSIDAGSVGSLLFSVGTNSALEVGYDLASAAGQFGDGMLHVFDSPAYSARLLDEPAAVPEPASLALLGLGLVAAGVARRRGGLG